MFLLRLYSLNKIRTKKVPYHSLEDNFGGSFFEIWYNALIAFMLNNGGFRSAEKIEEVF